MALVDQQQLDCKLPSVEKMRTNSCSTSTLTLKPEECPCGNSECFYRQAEINFDGNDTKCTKGIDDQIVALFQNIWMAAYARKLTPCIPNAVFACINACRRTESPDEHLAQFYDLRLQGHTLLASIILLSPMDEPSEKVRRSVIESILKVPPPNSKIRDELYLACGIADCNPYFSLVRSASLDIQNKDSPDTKQTRREIGKELRSQMGFKNDVEVESTRKGFRLNWFVPDMLQSLRLGMPVGTQFVSKGQVWEMRLDTEDKDNRITFTLRLIKPYRNEVALLRTKLTISPTRTSWLSGYQILDYSVSELTSEFPESFYKATKATNKFYKHINKDGGCFINIKGDINI